MVRVAVLIMAAVAAQGAPTFTKDVAPILHRRCAGCHRPGDVAPMSLLDYTSARPWAKSIRAAVLKRTMPPWFADPHYGKFANDARLSDGEIETIRAWVDGGAPEGDRAAMPEAPRFVEGWRLGKPDLVVDIGEDFAVKPGLDSYEHFTVDTGLKEGVWVRAAEIRPGNRRVVHHVHVNLVADDSDAGSTSIQSMNSLDKYLVHEGNLTRLRADAPVVNDSCADAPAGLPYLTGTQEGGLAAYLPGRDPDAFPEGTGKWIPAGGKFRFVIHYAKIDGEVQRDRTSVGLYFLPGPPRQPLRRMDMRNFFFAIPPRAAAHRVTRCYDVTEDRLILSITPHMHYRGRAAKYEVVHAGGRRETVLSVPEYDFNWQLNYRFANPVLAPKGSRFAVTFEYDNSPNNKSNPDPSQTLRWGDKSEEEMMTSWIEWLPARAEAAGAR